MKKRNVFLAAFLAAATLVTSIPVMADDNTTVYTDNPTEASMLVGATIPSTYTVTVPKKITLQKDSDGNSTANYTVSVKGDIAANERLSVGLKKTTITMSQSGKENVTATARINQNNLDFDDIDDIGYDIGGDVAATKLTAGT